MEKGSCSRNSRKNRRGEIEVSSGLDSIAGSVSVQNVSLNRSNRNLGLEGLVDKEPENAETSYSSRKRYQFRNSNRHPELISDDEDDAGVDDDDEEYVINRRGSNSAQKRRNPNPSRRNNPRRKSTLRVRNCRGLSIQETHKRSILSWLIDSGTVPLNGQVCYMDWTSKRALLNGNITREGIFCGCCSKIVTVLEFEVHAGGEPGQPYQNIFIDKNISLLQCQINAWNRFEEMFKHNRPIINYEGDTNDDTCGVCGDGGNLICCDACPSTFHQNCLGIEVLPQGDWYCPLCLCKFCGIVGFRSNTLLLTCRQCEERFHRGCIRGEDATITFGHDGCTFCGQKCRQLFDQLQNLVGVKNEVESGITWSLIRSLDNDLTTPVNGLYKKMQCNSTLAATLAVMEECFVPMIDCRTGINMIRNIICNRGSNLRRLNFGGFYTAVLERGDEIISAASLRFHGTRLAEMPFIGTRNKYRCQGMCHRLLNAIESTFRSLDVEKLIIPSISDRVNKWINGYGFKHIDQSLKHEIRSMNLLTFPETVQLYKILLTSDVNDSANRTPAGDVGVRIYNRLRIPKPFDLNLQPPEEVETANNDLDKDKRPRFGVFIVLDIQERSIGFQRVQVRD